MPETTWWVRPESSRASRAHRSRPRACRSGPPVEMHRRVDPERPAPLAVTERGLADGVRADERDGVGVGRIVLHVRRCDDVERDAQLLEDRAALRRRRGEHEPSCRLLRDPDLLGRPLARPLRRERVVVRVVDGIVGRIQLDEVDDVEARPAEEAEQLAVRQLPLDADLARPLEPAEPTLRAQQRLGRRPFVGSAEDRERAVAEEPEPSARAGAAGTPPGARGADRTRCWRRTRRPRGRSSRRGAARPRRSPRRAGSRCPNSAWQRRAVASWAGVTSTPTGRAPRRASQAET